MSNEEFATSVGMDALRMCLGQPPRQHSVETVKRWLDAMTEIGACQVPTEYRR